jgi:hypothetical protein
MRGFSGCSFYMAKRTPKTRSRKAAPTLPGFANSGDPKQVWITRDTCLVRDGEWRRLVFHGTQAAAWRESETAIRNALLVQLAAEPKVILEDLAKAFELSSEAVRLIRRKAEQEGILAVMLPQPRGRAPLAPELRERMEKLFAQGLKSERVFEKLSQKVSRATISKYRSLWEARQQQPTPTEPCPQSLLPEPKKDASQANSLPSEDVVPARSPASTKAVADEQLPSVDHGEIRSPRDESAYVARERALETESTERAGTHQQLEDRQPRSRRGVQHAGVWLLTAMVGSLGLYESAAKLPQAASRPLRLAFDAVLAALGVGEGCVEGVRRLATRAAAALLLASAPPSATWVRRILGRQTSGAEEFHRDFAAKLFLAARHRAEPGKPVVFYVDNHTREYTGEQLLSWHWKMQRKRAVHGITDYWIHDALGRPITSLAAFQQGSLVEYLPRCARLIRGALGEEPRVLVVFDRGGAFPAAMSELKDLPEGQVDFLTYERAPFDLHGRAYFEKHGTVRRFEDVDGVRQRVVVLDRGTYLGEGRGRIRRLSLLLPDDAQLNLLTSSQEGAVWLAQTLFSRWSQENAFKYGKERWGFDQLDGRQVDAYPGETIIANPYRRNLERSRDGALLREGRLRCRIARMDRKNPKREGLEKELAEVSNMVQLIQDALKRTPMHTPLERTHLNGKLVHHRREYKLLVDTLRVAGMTAEDELARRLRPHLPAGAEAKRVLQNVFRATGNIQVAESQITITLDPAANRAELPAIRKLLNDLNREALMHPADPLRRPLQFRLQTASSAQRA